MGPLSALRQIVVIALHPACRVDHHGFAGVGVHIQSKRRRGMSHERLYAFYVRSGGNGYRSAGMPKIMGAQIRTAHACRKPFEISTERFYHHMSAQRIGKTRSCALSQSLPARNLFSTCLVRSLRR